MLILNTLDSTVELILNTLDSSVELILNTLDSSVELILNTLALVCMNDYLIQMSSVV